jgi:hypothetical protein
LIPGVGPGPRRDDEVIVFSQSLTLLRTLT